jgi:hypothetical protein
VSIADKTILVTGASRDVIGQAHHPRDAAGRVTAWEMAHRPSSRQRNRWVVSLLGIQPADQVLEIGFGPGVAIAELAREIEDLLRDGGFTHLSTRTTKAHDDLRLEY